uniref:PPIase cyclophilin-type domain-containing protein n=1 Tax=Lactuca sativa TaxID=4236 RepID=A0A9R1UQ76_LACSA|nr:hypothetical protein LSAT_V11C800450870 [Lactuca sativa]
MGMKHVVFGKVTKGMETIKKIELLGTSDGKPSGVVKIVDCGEVIEDKKNNVVEPLKEKRTVKKDTSSDNSSDRRVKKRRGSTVREKLRKRRKSSPSDSDFDSYSSEIHLLGVTGGRRDQQRKKSNNIRTNEKKKRRLSGKRSKRSVLTLGALAVQVKQKVEVAVRMMEKQIDVLQRPKIDLQRRTKSLPDLSRKEPESKVEIKDQNSKKTTLEEQELVKNGVVKEKEKENISNKPPAKQNQDSDDLSRPRNFDINIHGHISFSVHTLLKGLEKIVASADIPMLVCGDFNSVPGRVPLFNKNVRNLFPVKHDKYAIREFPKKNVIVNTET